MSLKDILKLVLSWRVLTILIAVPGLFLLAPRDRFMAYSGEPNSSHIFNMWSNFDGMNYLRIAEHGFGYGRRFESDFVYFPFYPLVLRSINVLNNYLATGLLFSHLCLVLSLFCLYQLVALDFKKNIAKNCLYLLLIFPTSFFLASTYPDSLFLLLSLLTFFYARKKNFLLAGIVASLASASNISGIFLWPSLIYEFWQSHGRNLRRSLTPSAVWLGLPPIGLLLFLRFQSIYTGLNYFASYLRASFNGQTVDKLVLLHQIFFRYAKMFLFTDHLDPLFFSIILELVSASLVLLVIIFSFKKIRFSYWVFTLLSFLLPTFSGSFMGLPRYTIVLFPVFIFLSAWFEEQHPFWKLSYYTLCIIGTLFSILFFTRGYFVG